MVKVGDKVVVVSCPDWENCSVGDVLEVFRIPNPLGFLARSMKGEENYVRMDGMEGRADVIVRPYTESEAEKRGAKFGAMGVVKATGKRCVYICDSFVITGNWEIYVEGEANHRHVHPSRIRLDHEPEFVAWKDAPEELKYVASGVYYQGEPVKWIAKPEGVKTTDVCYVASGGYIRLSSDDLTVKL